MIVAYTTLLIPHPNPTPKLNLCSNRQFGCSTLLFGSDCSNSGRPERLLSVVTGEGKMEWLRGLGVGCFRDRRGSGGNTGNGRLKVEEYSGGEDVLGAAAAVGKVLPEHLVIMVNGIVGSSADWRYAADQFVKRLPNKVIVHRSECNTSKLTFDGVDLMGERLADEVLAVVRHRPHVRKISFVAHSLGGLIARYAVAKLYEPVPTLGHVGPQNSLTEEHKSRMPLTEEHINRMQYVDQPFDARIAGLEPINFITVATPHLGSRGNKQLPFLCGLPFLEKSASQSAHLVAGRTGKHLFLNDGKDGKPPLLLQMVKDSDGLKFISALRAFRRRVAYANANYDHMVGWRTSSIRRQHELPKANLLVVDPKYPHVVYVQREPTDKSYHPLVEQPSTDLEEEMIKGLTQVPWERVDVSFQKSGQRYIAHTTIQVKTYWLNSDGADVVTHMIDNFRL